VALKLGSTGSALRVGSTTAKYARVGTTLKAVAPPLDIAGSAAAAYSLRKLSYAYTGPVVEVRRSSDDTTADFTADEVEDGTLAAWVGAGNDGFVATWYDQSGNSRDATQATAGSQPKVVSSGAVILKEGKPAIDFDGTDDFLAIGTLGISGNNSRSIFALVSQDVYPSVAGAPFFGVQKESASEGQLYDLCIETGQLMLRIIGNAVYQDAGNNLQQRLWSVLFASGLSDTIQVYKDGASLPYTGGSVKTIDTVDGLFAIAAGNPSHSNQYFNGTMQEIFVYPADQTANRTAIEGNLCWHYGLENKLPYNHAEVKPQTLPTDTDVLAFAAASGAVSIPDLLKIEDLVAYLKAESLWDYARFYPMKSSQNAGSGSTVYGLGGLTSNNMTLVNSPTWGSDGVTFNGSTQYGNCGRLFNGGDITAFASVRYLSTPAATGSWFGQYSGSINKRSFAAGVAGAEAGDPIRLFRFPNGTSSPLDVYDALGASYPTAAQETLVVQWAGTNVGLWIDNVSKALTLSIGTPQSYALNANQPVYFGASNDNGSAGLYANIESSAFLFLTGTGTAPTDTQREAITDLINAL